MIIIKWVTVLGLGLLSFQALAMPKVGDSATYKMEITDFSGGAYIGAEVQNSLVDYDKKLKKFKHKQIIKYETGKKDERVDLISEEVFTTLEQMQNTVTNCIQMGNQQEVIKVADKEYAACKVRSRSDEGFEGFKWVAAVPFGYVKSLYIISDKLMMGTRLLNFKK